LFQQGSLIIADQFVVSEKSEAHTMRDLKSLLHDQMFGWDVSYDNLIRLMVLAFDSNIKYSRELLTIINSTQEIVELNQHLYFYEKCLENQEMLEEQSFHSIIE
jgi:hypothetical protein